MKLRSASKRHIMSFLIGRLAGLRVSRFRIVSHGYCRMAQSETLNNRTTRYSAEDQRHDTEKRSVDSRDVQRGEQAGILAKKLCLLDNSKEAVYGILDASVVWEERFPTRMIRWALKNLEDKQEWHRMVQVIKWMLSKGQGNSLVMYGKLILALDMDGRADEAHEFWEKKLGPHILSVPWQLCRRMIAIHHRNQNYDKLIKLFEELEGLDRKAPDETIVMRAANAYEALGKVDEKERVLEKYRDILPLDGQWPPRKSKRKNTTMERTEFPRLG